MPRHLNTWKGATRLTESRWLEMLGERATLNLKLSLQMSFLGMAMTTLPVFVPLLLPLALTHPIHSEMSLPPSLSPLFVYHAIEIHRRNEQLNGHIVGPALKIEDGHHDWDFDNGDKYSGTFKSKYTVVILWGKKEEKERKKRKNKQSFSSRSESTFL